MFNILLYKTKKRRKFINELKEYTEKIFEDIKYIDEDGNEFWYERELQIALDYKKWQKFINVKENAKIACK